MTPWRNPQSSDADRSRHFQQLFDATQTDILAYALRRVARPDDAADVVAETYLVAWRRLEEVPAGEAARLWLFGVAPRQLLNAQRGELRRSRLADRLREELGATSPTAPDVEDRRAMALGAALANLSEQDRELVRLAYWEELSPTEISAVMGASSVTVRSRLHRVRKRLARSVDVVEGAADPAGPAHLTPEEAR